MLNFKAIFFISILSSLSITNAEIPAVGYSNLNFDPPKPGSYKLYKISKAEDGIIIDQNNEPHSLHKMMHNKITLLGFVYLNCSDVNGCPLTAFVVQQLKNEVQKVENLYGNVKIISLSFDPKRDTPEYLKKHANHMGADGDIWTLTTTSDEDMLQPLLEKYNQPIQIIYDKEGNETGEINHVLRVFLIDRNKQIRNIYSTAFLHKDILLNDIKTILLEDNPNMTFHRSMKKEMHSHGMHHH